MVIGGGLKRRHWWYTSTPQEGVFGAFVPFCCASVRVANIISCCPNHCKQRLCTLRTDCHFNVLVTSILRRCFWGSFCFTFSLPSSLSSSHLFASLFEFQRDGLDPSKGFHALFSFSISSDNLIKTIVVFWGKWLICMDLTGNIRIELSNWFLKKLLSDSFHISHGIMHICVAIHGWVAYRGFKMWNRERKNIKWADSGEVGKIFNMNEECSTYQCLFPPQSNGNLLLLEIVSCQIGARQRDSDWH